MSTTSVESGRPSTGSMPITDAIYGKKGRARRARPKRNDAPRRHEFRIEIPADTRQKLSALQGRLEKKTAAKKRRRRRPAATVGCWRAYRVSPPHAKKARESWTRMGKRRQARGKKGNWLRQQLRGALGYR